MLNHAKEILASIDPKKLSNTEKIAFCQSAALMEQAAALRSFSNSFEWAVRGSNQTPGAFEKIAMELDSLAKSFEGIESSIREYVSIAASAQTEED